MKSENDAAKKGMRNVMFLGLVSFFADISAEMVYPLIPLYLTMAFGATPVMVGFIEGIAESIASLLKVFSGYISDRFQRKKAIAFCGYATGVIYKIALLFATSWLGILAARVIDRFGKGVRTAPRDVMVSESADKNSMGHAFGIHKMLDMAGSAIGILLAFLFLKYIGESGYKLVFAISIIPVLLALLMFAFIKEEKHHVIKEREHFWKNISQLDKQLKVYLAVTFLFTLGNSSNSFLLLRAVDAGFSSSDAVLLYFLYTLTVSLLAIPCGKLSDKVGRKRLLVPGYVTFALVYLGFALCVNKVAMVFIFILYGVYGAMTTGVERAFIAEIAPSHLKGTMLGLHSTLAGIALLPASVVAGFLWQGIGAYAPFLYGSAMALLSAAILAKNLRGAK